MTAAEATIALRTGITLSYTAQGDASGLAVVFLPGPTDSWRSYEPVLDHLPSSIRAVAVSARGHGDSDKPAAGYGVEDFTGDVVALLDGLGIEWAVLAGHSGSCFVARRVAIDHPGRVAGLLLEASPVTLRGDAGLTEFVTTVVAGLEDPIDPAFIRAFVVDTSSDDLAPEAVDQIAGESSKVPTRVWRQTFARLLEYDDVAELGRITAPALLVWGDADGLVGRDVQEVLRQHLRHADLLVYRGAGHTPRWDDPKRFAADVVTFVERLRSTLR